MKSKIKNFIKKWDWLGCVLKVINIKYDIFISKFTSEEKYIIKQYKKRTGKKLNLDNPKTFNEKIQWLKLYYKNDKMHNCVDKYEARKIVEEKIGDNILIKNYGVWDNFDDINFEKLPNEFILKLTNGSSFNYICTNKNKKEINKMRRRFKMWQRVNYYGYAKEWAYKNVKNRIICEELLKPSNGIPPEDYRFFCFNGKVKYFTVDYDSVVNGIKNSDYKRNVYDLKGNKIEARIKYPNKEEIKEEKQPEIRKMIEYAEILSKEFPHARIDFYCFDKKIYFGEITFYHASGYQKITPNEFENELGDLIDLNKIIKSQSDYKVQNLISIMNSNEPSKYIRQMNILDGYVIINQVTKEDIKLINNEKTEHQKIISVKEKGLSKSRNLALKNLTSEIAVLSDDDMVYNDEYINIIKKGYKKYPDADIIAFDVKKEDNFKSLTNLKEGKVNFISSMKLSSVQLTFKNQSIKSNNILFDERFGSGSKYNNGEENIFLSDCYKNKLKIYYIPKTIGTLKNLHESSWFKGYNEDFFKTKGAIFYRISNHMYLPLIMQFCIRKRNLYKDKYKFKTVMKYMLNGVKEFKNEK